MTSFRNMTGPKMTGLLAIVFATTISFAILANAAALRNGAAIPISAVNPAGSASASAQTTILPDRIRGNIDAPVTVEEYISLTCPHCAEFYLTTLPELEKRYVDTGKVKFILRDFPLDGTALKAATIARCMPEEQFYPFITILYQTQTSWALLPNPESQIMQYARLGGLSEDKAKACLKDTKLQDAIVTERTDAAQKYNIESTPTFVMNNGAEKISGAVSIDAFSSLFDRLLAIKK
jgi:protein-disulfide isomerase